MRFFLGFPLTHKTVSNIDVQLHFLLTKQNNLMSPKQNKKTFSISLVYQLKNSLIRNNFFNRYVRSSSIVYEILNVELKDRFSRSKLKILKRGEKNILKSVVTSLTL